jgi:hypothetical protein
MKVMYKEKREKRGNKNDRVKKERQPKKTGNENDKKKKQKLVSEWW